jgi:hypothetical protein
MTTGDLQQLATVAMAVMINIDKSLWDKVIFDVDENQYDDFVNELAKIYKQRKVQYLRQKNFFDNLASNFKF